MADIASGGVDFDFEPTLSDQSLANMQKELQDTFGESMEAALDELANSTAHIDIDLNPKKQALDDFEKTMASPMTQAMQDAIESVRAEIASEDRKQMVDRVKEGMAANMGQETKHGADTSLGKFDLAMQGLAAMVTESDKLAASLDGTIEPLKKATSSWQGFLSTVGSTISTEVGALGNQVGEAVDKGGWGEAIGASIGSIVGSVFGAGPLGQMIGGLLGSITDQVVGWIGDMFSKVMGFVSKWNPALVEQVNIALDDMSAIIGRELEPILRATLPIIRQMTDLVSKLLTVFHPFIEMLREALVIITNALTTLGLSDTAGVGMSARGASTTSLAGLGESTVTGAFSAGRSAEERTADATEGLLRVLLMITPGGMGIAIARAIMGSRVPEPRMPSAD